MKTELIHSYDSKVTKNLKLPNFKTFANIPILNPLRKKSAEINDASSQDAEGQKGQYEHHNSQSGVKHPDHPTLENYTTLQNFDGNDEDFDGLENIPGSGGDGKNNPEQKESFFKSKAFRRKLPILTWLPDYNLNKLVSDFIAGITVGLTLIPQGLALANVAGLPPQYGLYSAFISCFVYIIFGSTKAVTIGPTAIMAIITLSYSHGKPPEYAVLLCFLTGVTTLIMGLCNLGFIVNFLSVPVISGFTSAAAITICFTQVKALLGLKFKAEGFVAVLFGVAHHISEINLNDLAVSIVCTAVLLFLRKLQTFCACAGNRSKIVDKILWVVATSRSVLVIVICTIAFAIIGDPKMIAFVADVHKGLPEFKVPAFHYQSPANHTASSVHEVLHEWRDFSILDLLRVDGSALITIPLLALMEHITSAKMFAGGERVDASQELVAIGISNIVSSFFSSMPICGAFSRTVVNKASGVETPMGGLFTGILVMVALQFLTPCFYYIPKAALAAVIVTAVIFTVDFQIVKLIWTSKRMDLIPWCLTFSISLLLGLEYGVLMGFLISVIYLMYWAARPRLGVRKGQTSSGTEFIVVEVDRSLTFPSVDYSRSVILKCGSRFAKTGTNDLMPLVIDCHHIQYADFSAGNVICELFQSFNSQEHPLILYKLKPSVSRIFTNLLALNAIPYKCCFTQEELEIVLHEIEQERKRKERELLAQKVFVNNVIQDTFSVVTSAVANVHPVDVPALENGLYCYENPSEVKIDE